MQCLHVSLRFFDKFCEIYAPYILISLFAMLILAAAAIGPGLWVKKRSLV